MSEREWKHGEDDQHEYYETGRWASRDSSTYACVWRNKPSGVWMCAVGNDAGGVENLYDKFENDRNRKAQGLPKWAPMRELNRTTMLCSKDPRALFGPCEDALESSEREFMMIRGLGRSM